MDKLQKRVGSSEIANLLRHDISHGDLALRERLAPERELAESYGVARGTVREALNQLAHEGLVEIRPGSGTYVTYDPVQSANSVLENARPLELIDARFALEPHLCRLAVLHARKGELDSMEVLIETMENSLRDPVAFADADTAFHTLLAESAGNTLLVWIVGQINSVRNQEQWSRMRHLTLHADTISIYNNQHRLILNAIRTREPERAASLMKEHLESARLSLTRAAAT